MGLVDKFLNAMRLNDDDDDYEFDNEDYEIEEEEEVEVPKKSFKTRESKATSRRSCEQEEKYTEPVKERPVKTTPKITPISRSNRKQVGLGMEVCVVKPSTVEDAREIAENLLNGRTVVLNVEGVPVDIAQRIIDFTSGSCFAISGNLQKIANYIFIITPENVDISGDFLSIADSIENSDFMY